MQQVGRENLLPRDASLAILCDARFKRRQLNFFQCATLRYKHLGSHDICLLEHKTCSYALNAIRFQIHFAVYCYSKNYNDHNVDEKNEQKLKIHRKKNHQKIPETIRKATSRPSIFLVISLRTALAHVGDDVTFALFLVFLLKFLAIMFYFRHKREIDPRLFSASNEDEKKV